ncbi:hypothetical protein GCM10027073_29620 [Streptomyces chlorus]
MPVTSSPPCCTSGVLSMMPSWLVSELATNAVRHTLSGSVGGWFLVVVGFGDDLVRIEVVDQGGHRVPHLCDTTSQEEGGRGLQMIVACAKEWGGEELARRALRVGRSCA